MVLGCPCGLLGVTEVILLVVDIDLPSAVVVDGHVILQLVVFSAGIYSSLTGASRGSFVPVIPLLSLFTGSTNSKIAVQSSKLGLHLFLLRCSTPSSDL